MGYNHTEVGMQNALTLYQTTIGKKVVMAVSGLVVFGFVIGHLAGNLNLYAGPTAINDYAAWLRSMPKLLWGARIGLIVAIVAHIVSSVQLANRNAAARSARYMKKVHKKANYASKTMYFSGPILLLFVLYHLAHLTLGRTPGYEFDPHNVYNNVVLGFQNPLIAAIYITANLALGLHLFHGAWSMLQTLGLSHPRYDVYRRQFASVIAALITLGNVSFPVTVMAGLVQPTDQSFCYEHLARQPGECGPRETQ
ncbi:MAG: succinate dehydrogenase cytochrome b subunit [Myxococcota bacterium]